MTTNIKQREIQYQRTPLPIETAFTMDDIAYNITKDENGNFIQQPIIDKDKFNRYYFNYPAEWKTSDTGEPIVGLRSIWIHKKKRKLEFQLCIRKYTKADMLKQLQANVPRYQNITSLEQLINNPPTDNEIEIAVSKIPNGKISTCNLPIECYINTHDDFIKLWQDVKEYFETYIVKINKEIDSKNSQWITWFAYRPKFVQVAIDANQARRNKDIEVVDIYEKDTFKVVFMSPRNTNTFESSIYEDSEFNEKDLECFVDFAIVPRHRNLSTLYKRYTDKDHGFKLKPVDEQVPLDETDTFPEDFNEVFNVGNESFQNSIDYITRFHRNLEFKHLWDRHSCKVYSSIAGQSMHFFLGNSQVNFHPIKYFKLNSRDDKFWIELYNADNPTIPVRLTPHEGYVMELQFMQNDKLLYI